jgi:hypothetical protein
LSDTPTPGWVADGVTAQEAEVFRDVYQRAVKEFRVLQDLDKRRLNQRITFSERNVTLVFLGDQHIGGPGTDIERVYEEARFVRDTPGMYAVTMGDVTDNFILDKLAKARRESHITLPEEWRLVDEYFRILGPKLILVVEGNHDHWTEDLTGKDFLRDLVVKYAPKALYDADDCRVSLAVGESEFPGRIRHKWQGTSIYNSTHAIERAWKFDHDFLWAVGAHDHRAGLARQFNAGGVTGIAAMVGSYKVIDRFPRRQGFPKANGATAVAVMFDGVQGAMLGTNNLTMAAQVMR